MKSATLCITHRGAGYRVLVVLLVAVVSIVPLSRSANAWQTATVCDPNAPPKYWCYTAFADTIIGGVTITSRLYEGKLGDGGATWWKRYITQDWHLDVGSGSWTFLGSWAPGAQHTNTAWESETVQVTRDVNNEAVVRMQNQFQATGTGNIFCDGYVDFHLSDTGSYWSQGPYGCLTPI